MEYEWDENRIEVADDRKDYGEKRYRTVGIVGRILLTIVFTPRHYRYRIISARRASHYEKKAYYRQEY